jgi:hypothetical protein
MREVSVQVVGVESSGDLGEIDAESVGAVVNGDELLFVGVADEFDLGACLLEGLTFDELHFEIEEGVLEFPLVVAVDEEELDLAGLLPLPAPAAFLLQPEGEPLSGTSSTCRWEWACGGRRW